MKGLVYLIPSLLAEGRIETIPAYIKEAIAACEIFFVEEERTTRRFFKLMWKEMVIDNYRWHNMRELSADDAQAFRNYLRDGRTIGIVSEAGCPGIADPGQQLVAMAQALGAKVKPLVGPSSILLALMASGLNGQSFHFHGYLPIEQRERERKIRELEQASRKDNCTEMFIETPYRNQQMLETILRACAGDTRLCIAVDITDPKEEIITKTVRDWKQSSLALHKRPAMFLLLA